MGNVSTLDTGFIVLEHDLFQQTVEMATGYILPDALARVPRLNITPVVSCLNMPMSNAYVETNNNKTNSVSNHNSNAFVEINNKTTNSVLG